MEDDDLTNCLIENKSNNEYFLGEFKKYIDRKIVQEEI